MRPKSIHTVSLLASAIALALPSSSLALGLGKLTVQSGLGQPLSAQIELTSGAREELDSLAAKVADPALYRQNNLSYQGVLSRARVSVERTQGGQAFLRVVTPTPVNEPYLDLMVEINWPSGRVVREYTFLLDPPGLPAPATAIEPVTPARAGAAAAPRAAAAAPAPAAREARGAASNRPANSYAVRRGDSLARIANQLRPESVSLEQMLVALFNANPGAFDGNNMNRLRSGSILSVPPPEEIAGTPEAEAAKVVRVQATDWRTYRDRVAAEAPSTEAGAGRESAGKITTSVQERTPAAQPGRDQVRVSRDAGVGKGGTGAAGAAEDAVARDRALRDAQVRIAELEKTLKDLQRAMEMRNQTMAQLQNQAEAKPGTGEGARAASSAVAAAAPSVASKAPEISKASEAPKLEAAKTEPPKVEPSKSEPAKAEPTMAPPSGTATVASPAAGTTTAAPKPDAGKGVKAAKAEPAASPSVVEEIWNNTPSWAVGVGALALLGGIGAVFAARRRRTASFEDSIISGTDIKSNTVFGSTGGGIVNTGENSLSSDFSREGISTIDTDEVDPIAEAEVYLAYGRDAQAEEILKDALKKDPQRQEVYLKLLEIHAQHNKPSAFDAVASELYSVSHGQGETWQKAVALGRQLDPNNPMFAESGASGATAPAAAAASEAADPGPHTEAPRGENVRAEAPRGPNAPPVPVGTVEFDHDRAMDFRLDEDISISPASAMNKKPTAEALAGEDTQIEKALRGHAAGLASGAQSAAARGTPGEPSGAESKFDLDFHLDESEKPAPLRASGSAESPATVPAERSQAAVDLDKLDLSFDHERATFEDPTPSVLDGQWHDAATKLDLAKAYQEMGDVEGAREILQEVLHEGDDQQKGEAGALLEKLG